MPTIGYGSAKKTRHVLPSGFIKFRVSNPRELQLLLMHNRKYAAEIAHNVSTRKVRPTLPCPCPCLPPTSSPAFLLSSPITCRYVLPAFAPSPVSATARLPLLARAIEMRRRRQRRERCTAPLARRHRFASL
jgi:hypothetical protein